MLRKLELRSSYSSESDDLYRDFFVPALSNAAIYRRAVGFFSLGVLLNAPSALSRVVGRGGRMELIFGKLVDPADFEAIRGGLADPWAGEELPRFEDLIAERPGSLLEHRVRLLAWLFANGNLHIKVAVRPRGMFHQKIGIIEDPIGDVVSFSGSMNETKSALDPRFNSEEISVFRSWNAGQREYVDTHVAAFARLWSGDTGSATSIHPLPEAIAAGLRIVAERFPEPPGPDDETRVVDEYEHPHRDSSPGTPTMPTAIGGASFSMRPHQLEALRAWRENGCNGMLELATGAGKTVTALFAATRLAQVNEGMAIVVAVPYQDLADQWVGELRAFNMHALRCYGSRAEWEPAFWEYLRRNRDEQRELLVIVVVNRTLVSAHFQKAARQLDPERLMFVGDECHHHAAEGFVDMLLPGAKFRLGLSATPFHYMDKIANDRLSLVYDRSVYSYDLADAVRDGVLTPYEYHPRPVELTPEEAVDYREISDQIARAFASQGDEGLGAGAERLQALLMRRARLVGSAANKMVELERLLDDHPVEPHSLFYCSDGRTTLGGNDDDGAEMKQRHAVAQTLMRRGVKVSPFTSDEDRRQRRLILDAFRHGEVDAMVAIRCLDEGIDVPACRTAYLIASSRNPRQFVQRRGRILRRSPGKDFAIIHDFVVVMPDPTGDGTTSAAADFLRAELQRVADFARNSLYPARSVAPLGPWLKRYGLEHLAA